MRVYRFSDGDDAIPIEEIEIDPAARSKPVDPRVPTGFQCEYF